MLRTTLLSCGIALLVCGCLLFVFALAGQTITDAEWGHISDTGLPSSPHKMHWLPWQTNDGSVYPFPTFQSEHRPDRLSEFRVGRGQTVFFDYVFYQGRFNRDGVTYEYPALGPTSGTVYHPFWACVSFAAGLFCLFAAWLVRRPAPRSPNHALQRTEAGGTSVSHP